MNNLLDFCEIFYKLAQMDLREILKQLSSLPTFATRKKLCDQNFKYLTSGTARAVYLLPDGRVLKLAKNPKGIAQNNNESNVLMQNSATNKSLDADQNDKWLITSLAKRVSKSRFQSLTGMNFDEYCRSLEYRAKEVFGKYKNLHLIKPNNYDQILNNEFFQEIIDLVGSWQLGIGDLTRLNSYGEVGGKIVLIDFGTTEDVYEQFYRKKR